MIDRNLAEQHLKLGLNQHARGKTGDAQLSYLAAIALLLADQQGILQNPTPTPTPGRLCRLCGTGHDKPPCPTYQGEDE